ncbi:MAG TPA: ABC transporter permease [Acidimicrobiales bacterium]|nr:ABC transporter permease [Acidimicrobiales bacterium]
MGRYIAKRLIQLVAITFILSIGVFMLVHLLPGDPTLAILGPNDTPTARHELLAQLGLNKSLPQQYWTWLTNVFSGNLGKSFLTGQTVANAVAVALPIDLELILFSQVMAIVVAVPLALLAARRPNRVLDRLATTTSFGMLSIPTFVVAVLLVLVFAVQFHAFPATGYVRFSTDPVQNVRSVILPSVALAFGSIAIYYRLLRADLIATMQEDYITMARSKGLSATYVLTRHALRPSSFTLLAGAGISIGSLFTGAFVVEVLFQLPGIGYQLVNAIFARDYLMVQGMALVAAVFYLVINFGVDFLLTVLDPRVRRA